MSRKQERKAMMQNGSYKQGKQHQGVENNQCKKAAKLLQYLKNYIKRT